MTSFLYFSIPVFQNETPELIARTGPDVRDVIIAFAGGLALIIAFSRRSKAITTISGVAIATALMPPLCTVGFGIANGQIVYLSGALYLFLINNANNFVNKVVFPGPAYPYKPKKLLSDNKKRKKNIPI